MWFAILLVALGIGLLVVGGETLLRGAVGLATLVRLTPAVIGLTVVAAGTSVPELAVSGVAAYQGNSEIAVANVVGSNVFNIAVIIGLCALIRPFNVTGNTLRLEYPVLAIVTFLSVLLMRDQQVQWWDAVLFVVIYVLFTIYLVRLVRRQMSSIESEPIRQEVEEMLWIGSGQPGSGQPGSGQPGSGQPGSGQIESGSHTARPNGWVCLILLVTGIVLLGLGAQSTVAGASQLARLWGWSERLIGLTIVSAGTGLPEVVASLVSSWRGRSDVAIGNVIGSNLFNILMILGLTGMVAPLPVQPAIVDFDCWWMMGVTLALLPILINGKRVYRWEGGLLLCAYAAYISMLLTAGSSN